VNLFQLMDRVIATGVDACRGKTPEQLRVVLAGARERREAAREQEAADGRYWYHRCFELEVEWVCNCVSVVLTQHRFPPIVPPTARAAMLVDRLLREGS
jgi:hypothetical protein